MVKRKNQNQKCELVSITTKDSLLLHGAFFEASRSNTAVLFIHGTGSSFYDESFTLPLAEGLVKNGASFLSANNRGASTLEIYQNTGAGTERFEDCITDIDGWVQFLIKKGYTKIVLCGHSLGTEKAVYYANYGKMKKYVGALVLVSFSDSYGTQMLFEKELGHSFMDEAEALIAKGRGDEFIKSVWKSHAGYLPMSAHAYVSFFKKSSELLKGLPFHLNQLPEFRRIELPIFAVIGDQEEYTVIPLQDAIHLLKKENKGTQIKQIKNCDHDFTRKEKILAKMVGGFIKKL